MSKLTFALIPAATLFVLTAAAPVQAGGPKDTAPTAARAGHVDDFQSRYERRRERLDRLRDVATRSGNAAHLKQIGELEARLEQWRSERQQRGADRRKDKPETKLERRETRSDRQGARQDQREQHHEVNAAQRDARRDAHLDGQTARPATREENRLDHRDENQPTRAERHEHRDALRGARQAARDAHPDRKLESRDTDPARAKAEEARTAKRNAKRQERSAARAKNPGRFKLGTQTRRPVPEKKRNPRPDFSARNTDAELEAMRREIDEDR